MILKFVLDLLMVYKRVESCDVVLSLVVAEFCPFLFVRALLSQEFIYRRCCYFVS